MCYFVACARNCKVCDVAGAAKCDTDSCASGFHHNTPSPSHTFFLMSLPTPANHTPRTPTHSLCIVFRHLHHCIELPPCRPILLPLNNYIPIQSIWWLLNPSLKMLSFRTTPFCLTNITLKTPSHIHSLTITKHITRRCMFYCSLWWELQRLYWSGNVCYMCFWIRHQCTCHAVWRWAFWWLCRVLISVR